MVLVIVTEPDEAVTVGRAGWTVTIPLAAAWPTLLMLHSRLYELLFSAELPCPLRRLEYVLILTTNSVDPDCY